MRNVGRHAQDALLVLGVICAMVVGGVAGIYCTWGFILVLSVVLGIVLVFTWLGSSSNSGFWTAFLYAGIPLFLISSWCSFWVSLAGVFRK